MPFMLLLNLCAYLHAGACFVGVAGWKLSGIVHDYMQRGQGTIPSILGLLYMHAHYCWRHKLWTLTQAGVSCLFWISEVPLLYKGIGKAWRLPWQLRDEYKVWRERSQLAAQLEGVGVDAYNHEDWQGFKLDRGLRQVLRCPCQDCIAQSK